MNLYIKCHDNSILIFVGPFFMLIILFLHLYNKPQDIEQINCKDKKLGEKRVT